MLDEGTIIQAASQLLAVTFFWVYLFQYLLTREEGKIKKTGIAYATAPIGFSFILSVLAAFAYSFLHATLFLITANLAFIFGVCMMLVMSVLFMLKEELERLGVKQLEKKELRARHQKVRGLLLSKWFYYGLIALALLAFIFVLLPYYVQKNVFSPDIGVNFHSEAWGLLFTLLIFIVLFDLREWLDWKSVEDRVRERIRRQILGLFAELSIFCKIDREHFDPLSEKKQADSIEKQLNILTSERIELTNEAKRDLLEVDLRRNWEWVLDSRRKNLSQIEQKYLRFLNSEIQASLMDIQDYLDSLCLQFRLRHTKEEDFFESFSSWTGKIMKEILKLKRKGIWLNP